MQLSIGFVCRGCGEDNELRTDTADAGVGALEPVVEDLLFEGRVGVLHPLRCGHCGHVSGLLGFHYRFDPSEHAPEHERLSGV